MPTEEQKEEYVAWLNAQLGDMGLDALYSTYLVSLLEQGSDAGCYLKSLAQGLEGVLAQDVQNLVTELGDRWYSYDDDDCLPLSQAPPFIDDDDAAASSGGALTPLTPSTTPLTSSAATAATAAVRSFASTPVTASPGGAAALTWRDDPAAAKLADIFGTQLSFDVVGLSAAAKEFTPGSAGSEGPRYLHADSNATAGSMGAMLGSRLASDGETFGAAEGDEGAAYSQDAFHLGAGGMGQEMDGYYYGDQGGGYGGVLVGANYGEGYVDQELEAEMAGMLAANFPDCGEECLRLALYKAEYDLESAAAMVQGALVKAAEKSHKQPCRHYLSGECLRRDCMFSHDFATTICRYWLQGTCRNGFTCLFVHDLEPADAVAAGAAASSVSPTPEEEEPLPFSGDAPVYQRGSSAATSRKNSIEFQGVFSEDFPALGSGGSQSSPAKTPSRTRSAPSPSTGASAAAAAAAAASPAGGVLQLAVEGLSYGPQVPSPVSSGKSFAAVVGSGASPQLQPSSSRRGSADSRRGAGRVRGGANSNGWVQTGEAVAAQYKTARSEAAELARSRNGYFMSATRAYRGGDAKSASALAAKGRELNGLMKERHRAAARCIYDARNPQQQVLERGVLDLHGLHVAEATALLEEELPVLCQAGLRAVSVVTGTGHHSRGSNYKARLLPAVERFCQDWGLYFERVTDKNGHIGMLHLTLSRDVLLGTNAEYSGRPAAAVAESPRRTIVIK
eukprot:TRINITY_DN11143_c0_g1_i1.p1 TRINITY_DN11143_c0_g1~~TRINITY_DN11143_c0_g1_i1.p1  ORF type:complete len:733 (+),score=253.24 TRINITY_DN11143_c0_g1_i1:124-2322(+)